MAASAAATTFAFEPPTPLSVIFEFTANERRIEPERDGRPRESVRLRFPLGFVRVDAAQAVVFALLGIFPLGGEWYAGSGASAVLSGDVVSTGGSRAVVR